MQLNEFKSELRKVNKLIENIHKEYGVKLTESNISDIITKQRLKLDWLIENVQDTMCNPAYSRASLIYRAANMAKCLLESHDDYCIHPKTGAIIDKSVTNTKPETPSTKHTVLDVNITNKYSKPIAGNKTKRINEDMAKGNHILMLAESEIEKAQIVMAVNNEIVEKLQRDAEKMSNMKIDILGPIVERIKAEHGLAPAEHFRDTITRLLDQALDTVMQVKDQIHTETLKLTGDISSAPSIEQDLSLDAGLDDDVETFEFSDEFTTDEPELEPIPAEREMKEAVSRLGVVLESTSGKMGKKYFSEATSMRKWLSENKDKIAKVHKILKE